MYTHIPISPPSFISLPPSRSHHSSWSESTELISLAMQLLPVSYLIYIWYCIYVNATLSLRPSLPFPPPVSSSPFSMSASLFCHGPRFLRTFFCLFVCFFRFHIYVLAYSICLLFLTYFTLYDRL